MHSSRCQVVLVNSTSSCTCIMDRDGIFMCRALLVIVNPTTTTARDISATAAERVWREACAAAQDESAAGMPSSVEFEVSYVQTGAEAAQAVQRRLLQLRWMSVTLLGPHSDVFKAAAIFSNLCPARHCARCENAKLTGSQKCHASTVVCQGPSAGGSPSARLLKGLMTEHLDHITLAPLALSIV